MRFRFMTLVSRGKEWYLRRQRCALARSQAGPQNVKGCFYSLMQRGIAVQGPDEQRAKNGLTKHMRDFRGWQIVADFTALLSNLDNLRVQSMSALLQDYRCLANGRC